MSAGYGIKFIPFSPYRQNFLENEHFLQLRDIKTEEINFENVKLKAEKIFSSILKVFFLSVFQI